VLLISIDGMHAIDYANCANGISTVNNGTPYCPNLVALGKNGINYLDASASRPSDSFPGLTALVNGGSPRSTGVFYDVAYDRSLDPPAKDTGNGVAAGSCTPGAAPTGTTTEYEEGIDIDQSKLNGGAPSSGGGINFIDPTRLPRDPARSCAPVFPWNFVRTNTIFGVVHGKGGYTAWSDKHPSYSSVSGPGDGSNIDDYYSPEINSLVEALPGVTTPAGLSCWPILDPSQTGSWADSLQNIQCYDTLKVNAILNEIDGKTHDGKSPAPFPNLFGMNFQAVSVGQKLIEKNVAKGGHLDSLGTPSNELLSEIQFVDASIGEMVAHLKKQGHLGSTLIVISAKHGQTPVDPNASSRSRDPAAQTVKRLPTFLRRCYLFQNHRRTRRESAPPRTTFRCCGSPMEAKRRVPLQRSKRMPRPRESARSSQARHSPSSTILLACLRTAIPEHRISSSSRISAWSTREAARNSRNMVALGTTTLT
jgi:Type I phosphodiesterase / nucleotide pyrophosphatase